MLGSSVRDRGGAEGFRATRHDMSAPSFFLLVLTGSCREDVFLVDLVLYPGHHVVHVLRGGALLRGSARPCRIDRVFSPIPCHATSKTCMMSEHMTCQEREQKKSRHVDAHTSHGITSHHITSHHITSHHTTPHHTTPYRRGDSGHVHSIVLPPGRGLATEHARRISAQDPPPTNREHIKLDVKNNSRPASSSV